MSSKDPPAVMLLPINSVSFHVYQWLWASEAVDLDSLIQEAFDSADKAPGFVLTSGQVHDAVCPQLAYLLEVRLEELVEDYLMLITGTRPSIKDMRLFSDPDQPPDYSLDTEALVLPLLSVVWADVDFEALAEALLRRAGKWHKPDRTRPEIL